GPRRLDPWLSDGNVVLAVEGGYFRVHRVVLSSASRVFHDMFSSQQTNKSADRKVDGCPVVTLHDSAPEVQIVLKTLYTRPQRISAEAPMHVSVVTAFLRLGKKYEIRWLFDEACWRIKECYPSSLFSLLFLPPDLKHPVTGRDKYDFQLINLAREFGLLSLLPVAMYRCVCSSPLTAILDGYYFDGSLYHLTPANQKSCIMGRDKLLELRSLTFGWLKRQRPCCIDEVKCALGNFATITELWCTDRPSSRDPFMRWDPRWDSRFCSNCMIFCHREIEDGREDAWDGLPSAFGFSSWERL
ncbi:hypothetical protein L210DRAFT_3315703, partial [Boletus edulis BED1]